MAQPRILILRAPGTNCDEESAHAFSLAGGAAERWHVNRVLEEPRRLAEFQILCIPGGFSYGDDIAAGRIFGNQMQNHLAQALAEFREAGKLILGICNGFQVLLKTNLLLPADERGPLATLALNDSGRFEARWVRLAADAGNCVFLQGIHELELPVAHAEGRFVVRDETVMASLWEQGQLALRYRATVNESSIRAEFEKLSIPSAEKQFLTDVKAQFQREALATDEWAPYPANPNGAMGNVAGICDTTGRVFGLMPHPERFVDPTQHPRWTREPARTSGDGLRVFQNAVRYFL
jgi:phosphoribosylformylglycinamidine (FGAM) synthase-like amidotransferase family enzyme